MEVIYLKKMPIFTEILLLLIRQNTIPYGQRHYQCLGPYGIVFCINQAEDGKWAIIWSPIFATVYVSFATTFLYQATCKKCYFLTLNILSTILSVTVQLFYVPTEY